MLESLINTVDILSRNFGVVLGLVVLLYAIQRVTSVIVLTNFKRGGYYFLACFGVAIHELSHSSMCLIFGHKINKIVLFRANSSGGLGYVDHSYNPKNIYHQIGNFFIGFAPLLGGPIAITLITIVFLHNGDDIVKFLFSIESDLRAVTSSSSLFLLIGYKMEGLVKLLFSAYKNNVPVFFIWLYLSSSVALHLSPSPTDLKGSLLGGGLVLLLLVSLPLVINIDILYAVLGSIIIPLSTILILCVTLATGLSITILSISMLFRR